MNAALWNRIGVDYAALSRGLLDTQKAHSRVTHGRDDNLIETYIGMAIGIVERRANVNLVPATYETVGTDVGRAIGSPVGWRQPWGTWGYLLPFNNVRAVRVLDADDVDITGAWFVSQQQFGGNADAYLLNPAAPVMLPTGGTLQLDVGLDDVVDLDPALLSVVLRIAASLYEYREANLALTEDTFAPELMQVWRPTA